MDINNDISVSENKPEECSGAKKELFEWIEVFASVIVVVVLLFTFVFKVATIEGQSMENTLFENEKVVMTNLFYEPSYGDIVVISRNAESVYNPDTNRSDLPIIKRVIATEGQKVYIDFNSGKVFVDDKELNEPYVKTDTNLKYDIEFPVTVPENCVFVMGDNRNNSLDSRSSAIGENGMVNTDYILGHVLLRIYPFDKFGKLTEY